ncbi:MAG: heat shock protein HspQ [Alphaproteobacteria bacterium]|nr:heat shock protein HspQ [Alphaproteobacteria bacterium]
MTDPVTAKFAPGDLVLHSLFDYRGVVVDLDPHFLGSEEWYTNVAKSRPPKDRPWYHVLVDGGDIRTYVAERNLEADPSGQPISHPDISDYFLKLGDDGYVPLRNGN